MPRVGPTRLGVAKPLALATGPGVSSRVPVSATAVAGSLTRLLKIC